MARRRPTQVRLEGMDDCILGLHYPAARTGTPVLVYSADMIAARLRDNTGLTQAQARCHIVDEIELADLGEGAPILVWIDPSQIPG